MSTTTKIYEITPPPCSAGLRAAIHAMPKSHQLLHKYGCPVFIHNGGAVLVPVTAANKTRIHEGRR